MRLWSFKFQTRSPDFMFESRPRRVLVRQKAVEVKDGEFMHFRHLVCEVPV